MNFAKPKHTKQEANEFRKKLTKRNATVGLQHVTLQCKRRDDSSINRLLQSTLLTMITLMAK